MKIEIKNRWSGALIFECDAESLRVAVELAVSQNISLRDANLRDANLSAANLSAAKNVGDFTMVDGLKFSEYLKSVVPALLTADGKTMEQVVASGCWECHSWDNCPMAVAFGIKSPDEGPPLLRARIKEFVQFFDARLIPCPTWANVLPA